MDWQIFWTALTGAVGGAIIGAGATLLVTLLNHRHEHKKWLREEKLTTYVEFIRITETVFHKPAFMETTAEEAQKMVNNITSTLARIDLLAPAHVSKKCDELREYVTAEVGSEKHKKYKKCRRELRDVMRADIQHQSRKPSEKHKEST